MLFFQPEKKQNLKPPNRCLGTIKELLIFCVIYVWGKRLSLLMLHKSDENYKSMADYFSGDSEDWNSTAPFKIIIH